MRLVADENIDQPIIDALRNDGHEVISIAEIDPGITDSDVLKISRGSGCPLLTPDKDFGELVFRDRKEHRGILLIRLAGCNPDEKVRAVLQAIGAHGGSLVDHFAVLTSNSLRIKRHR